MRFGFFRQTKMPNDLRSVINHLVLNMLRVT